MSSAPAPGGAFDRYVQRGGAPAAAGGNTVRSYRCVGAGSFVACAAGSGLDAGCGFGIRC